MELVKQLLVLPITKSEINQTPHQKAKYCAYNSVVNVKVSSMVHLKILTGFITSMEASDCESTNAPPIRLGTL